MRLYCRTSGISGRRPKTLAKLGVFLGKVKLAKDLIRIDYLKNGLLSWPMSIGRIKSLKCKRLFSTVAVGAFKSSLGKVFSKAI